MCATAWQCWIVFKGKFSNSFCIKEGKYLTVSKRHPCPRNLPWRHTLMSVVRPWRIQWRKLPRLAFDSKSMRLTARSSTWRIISWVHTLPLASSSFSFLIPSSTVIMASFRSSTKVVRCWDQRKRDREEKLWVQKIKPSPRVFSQRRMNVRNEWVSGEPKA